MKITKQTVTADKVILDAESVIQARSYGGAYDIEDDMFFTRDDLDDLVEDVVDKLNDDPRYPGGFRYVDSYFSSPQHVVVKVSGQDGEDFQGDAYIDMRRIRKPSDLRKYADDIILNMERDMYDVYGATDVVASEDILRDYINFVSEHPERADESGSYVDFDDGVAWFWPYYDDPNTWHLVIHDESKWNPDTLLYEDDKYWGDEEVTDQGSNKERLSKSQLLKTLKQLPGAVADNFYGIRSVIDEITSATDIDTSESDDSAYDNGVFELKQKYSSKGTAVNGRQGRLPAIFKMINIPNGALVLDYGGGDSSGEAVAQNYLDKFNATELIYDKFLQTPEHNRQVIAKCKANGGADITVCSNMLNVISEPEVRKNALENIKQLTKPSGVVYITVHEGNGKGQSRATGKDQYQLYRKTSQYMDEIQEVFPDAIRKGKLIIAHPNGSAKVTSATKVFPSDIQVVAKAAADVSSEADLNKVLGSLLSIDKQMYLHYCELSRSGEYSPAALGSMISDELSSIGKDAVNSSTYVDALADVDSIAADVQYAVRNFMISSGGFPEDEVDSYYAVDVEETDDERIKVEVRAELGYSSLEKLIDVLNPIIAEYDKYAYFEPVTSGIIDAYIESDDVTASQAVFGYDIDDARNEWLNPDNYYADYDEVDGQADVAVVTITNCPVTVKDYTPDIDINDWSLWATIDDIDDTYHLRISDDSLVETAVDMLLDNINDFPAEGEYFLSGSVKLVYDFSGAFKVDYEEYTYDTSEADISLDTSASEIYDAKMEPVV